MTSVTLHLLYPNEPDMTFDIAYYTSRHLPLALEIWGEAVLRASVAEGVSTPGGDEPPYRCIVQIEFASEAAFRAAMASPRAPELSADLANFSSVRPAAQIGRIPA